MSKRSLSIILAAVLVILLVTGCKKQEPEGSIALYFTNETFTALYSSKASNESLSPWKDTETYVSAVLERLQVPKEYKAKEDEDAALFSIIPEDLIERVSVKTIYSEGFNDPEGEESILNIVRILLSKTYEEMTQNEWAVFRTGVSQTLFSTGVIAEIEFAIADANGDEVLVDHTYSTDRVIINTYNEDFYNDENRVVLYFMNEEKTALVPEVRMLKLGFSQPLTEAIMDALISGPEKEGHLATIPVGTQINKILVEDGVCYVDLSQEFQMNHEGGELLEKLTIYSIVNSLQSVNSVVYVQFLIDGAKVDTYKAYVPLNHFLTPDSSLLYISEESE